MILNLLKFKSSNIHEIHADVYKEKKNSYKKSTKFNDLSKFILFEKCTSFKRNVRVNLLFCNKIVKETEK